MGEIWGMWSKHGRLLEANLNKEYIWTLFWKAMEECGLYRGIMPELCNTASVYSFKLNGSNFI
jgi:hypothetical protein